MVYVNNCSEANLSDVISYFNSFSHIFVLFAKSSALIAYAKQKW